MNNFTAQLKQAFGAVLHEQLMEDFWVFSVAGSGVNSLSSELSVLYHAHLFLLFVYFSRKRAETAYSLPANDSQK